MKSLDASAYRTDKAINTHYLRNFELYFSPLADAEVKLLELGVKDGGSLLLWRDYFERGTIVGLDINSVSLSDPSGRIHVYTGRQEDVRLLDRIAAEQAPDGFDIIIDDCSHIGHLTRTSFWHLFDHHLKAGGVYVIEDWGTGYWPTWPDGVAYRKAATVSAGHPRLRLRDRLASLQERWMIGRIPFARPVIASAKAAASRKEFHSHDYGLVGFVKELVDEAGMGDITHQANGIRPYRPSRFTELRISHGHVFVVKAPAAAPA
jgi:hypothetical protein